MCAGPASEVSLNAADMFDIDYEQSLGLAEPVIDDPAVAM